jgi:alpha-tubulin suppressor-like RCC1 family protein
MKYIISLLAVLVALFLTASVHGQTQYTLAAGEHFFLEIADGGLWGWGKNEFGNLGLGDQVNRPTPQPVSLSPALSGNPVSVCAGEAFHCVLDDEKNVACAGSDTYAQIGVGDSEVPTSVLIIPTGVSMVTQLACGPRSVMVTTTTGVLKGWGWNVFGGLGLGHSNTNVWEAEVGFCLSRGVVFEEMTPPNIHYIICLSVCPGLL